MTSHQQGPTGINKLKHPAPCKPESAPGDPAPGTRRPKPGTLFVVATPIGNLTDLSPRAVATLKQADRIACEDTRHTGKLLSHFQIETPTTSYHEHNEEARSRELFRQLAGGQNIALVSDAGTPLLSDPGYRLVRLCRQSQIPVLAIPGPSALTAALSISGLATDRFYFVGFLAKKGGSRRRQLLEISSFPATLVLYLAPHRLLHVLKEILEILGDREAFLVREMTKHYEDQYFGSLACLIEQLAQKGPRGEYTLVLAGASSRQTVAPIDLPAYVNGLEETRGLTQKEAIGQAAQELGLPKREIYRWVVDSRQTTDSVRPGTQNAKPRT